MKFINIKEKVGSNILLVGLGDVHYGSRDCDVEQFEKTVDWIRKTKNARVILMGDTTDCALRDSVGGGSFDNDVTPEQQLEYMMDKLTPIKDKIWCVLSGNHSKRIKDKTSIDVDKILAKTISVPYAGDGTLIKAKVGSQNYIIFATHGSAGASTPSGKLGAVMKYGDYIDADLFLMGHCFDEKTEILSNSGWKKYYEVTKLDKVLTLNKYTKQLEYNKINKFIFNPIETNWISVNNANTDLLVTSEHGMIALEARTNKLLEITAEQLKNKYNGRKIINAGNINPAQYDINPDILKLLIWIITDGTYHHGKSRIRWHLFKQRKLQKLTDLLAKLDIEFKIKKSQWKTSVGNTSYNIYARLGYNIIKYLPDIKHLPTFIKYLDKRNAMMVLNTYIDTDGCKTGPNCIQICSSKEREIDILQEMCIKNDTRCNKIKHNTCYILSINTRRNCSTLTKSSNQIKSVNYTGVSWCVSVDNQTIVVRRNGKVSITQNCHELLYHATDYLKLNLKDKMIVQDKRHYVITGHFLKYGGYAEAKGYAPGKSGVAKITLNHKKKEVDVVL